jgi:hypothetical protein
VAAHAVAAIRSAAGGRGGRAPRAFAASIASGGWTPRGTDSARSSVEEERSACFAASARTRSLLARHAEGLASVQVESRCPAIDAGAASHLAGRKWNAIARAHRAGSGRSAWTPPSRLPDPRARLRVRDLRRCAGGEERLPKNDVPK